MAKLGVNIDHVATLRQARRGAQPDPVRAAITCEKAGCDSIVAHLREDRRHINDGDIIKLKRAVKSMFNLEMSTNEKIVKIACEIKPDQATLVPEKREEITTEGGLDVAVNAKKVRSAILKLEAVGIDVSLFVDPDEKQIHVSRAVGARIIEIHTGRYAEAKSTKEAKKELACIINAAKFAHKYGIRVNAGHGLNYENVKAVAAIEHIQELNIGHSIISYAIFYGLNKAVKDMISLIG